MNKERKDQSHDCGHYLAAKMKTSYISSMLQTPKFFSVFYSLVIPVILLLSDIKLSDSRVKNNS